MLGFVPAHLSATYRRIKNVDLKIPDDVSVEAADLIRKVGIIVMHVRADLMIQLLRHNPEDRLPLSEVLTHPWIKRYEKKRSTGGVTRES